MNRRSPIPQHLLTAVFAAVLVGGCDRGTPSSAAKAGAEPAAATPEGLSRIAESYPQSADSADQPQLPVAPDEIVIEDARTQKDARLMSEGPLEQRVAAAERLLQNPTDESLAAFIAAVNGSSPELKVAMCQWISQANMVGIRERILRVLPLADKETARALAASLGNSADADFIQMLVDTIGQAGSRRAADNMLAIVRGAVSPEATSPLLQVISNYSAADPLVAAAAQALVTSGSPASVNGVIAKIDACTDPDEIAGLSAILAGVTDPRAQQTLVYAAEGNKSSQNPMTRAAAVRSLANYPTQEVKELLVRLQSDPETPVRAAASSAIASINRQLASQ